MLERALIALAIMMFGLAVYAITRGLHMLRTSKLLPVRNEPTLLYFRSDSCGPCRAQARYLEQVQQDFAGQIVFEKVDADADAERAAKFGVFTVPTTLVIDRAGNVRHINYGLTDARKLARQIHSLAQTAESRA